MEDEYEYTSLSDDAVALDTDTEMKDYHEKDIVVLDSDDEGLEQNEAGNLVNMECFPSSRRFSSRHTMDLLKTQRIRAGHFRKLDGKVSSHRLLQLNPAKTARWVEESNASRNSFDNSIQDCRVVVDCVISRSEDQKPTPTIAENFHVETENLNMVRESLTNELLDERKLPSHKSKVTDMVKGANLNYIESPEHSESHSKALDYVDHYLSVSDLDSYKNVETRKIERIMSPPSLRLKGSQSLARRVHVGNSATIFDWAEKQVHKGEYTYLRKPKDSIIGFLGDESGYLFLNQDSGDVNLQKEKMSSPHSKEKPLGNISSPSNLDTSPMDSNDIEKIGSNSEVCIAYDSMDLEELFDAGLSKENVEKDEEVKVTPYALDIGLDTQIAAEAMEALVHAAPPIFDACFAHQNPDNTFLDSFSSVNRKSKPEKFAKPKEAFVGWRKKEKRSKCVKMSNALDKNIFSFVEKQSKKQRTVTESIVSENLMTEKLLSGKDLNCRKTVNTENRKCGVSARITVLQEQHRERDNSMEFQKDNCFPESYGSNQEARRSNDSIQKLNAWIHPKGKRARQYVPQHSVRSSNQCSPCVALENNAEKSPTVNEVANKKVSGLLVYTRRRQFSSKSKHLENSVERAADSTSPSVNHNAKSPEQFGKSNEGHFPPSVYTSGNLKSDVLSNGLQPSEDSDRLKQPSRSPLMKELTRLGYTESLPDFLPKDSRRRRAMEKCCILFSQNLDTSILKQQKRTVARLGFSIASCCSDATHFVTDKFVRTRNMLEAIALGKPVVTHLWLESCEQAGYVIDEKNYILRDEKKEREIGFSMPASVTRASQRPLLKGHRVFITPNVKPSIDAINCLVEAVHGKIVQNIWRGKTKNKAIPDDLLILSCEDDYKICVQFLEKGASIYNSELLLHGIVTQRLEYERHQLFKEFSNNGSL